MVSLRNEVRKKRLAAENKLVQISQVFLQPIQKIICTEHPTSNASPRVSNDTDGNALGVKIEGPRVCTEGNAGVCSGESARVCADEGSRICANEDDGVCTNENSSVCVNGSSRVSASGSGAEQLLIPKEEKEEKIRVSIGRDDSAFEGLARKAKMQSPLSGADEDEDNVPIIKSLMRCKKDEEDDNNPISRILIHDKKNEDEDNVPISRMLTRSKKGDVLQKQLPCLQTHSDGQIPLRNLSPGEYNLPGRGNDVFVKKQNNSQKIKKVIRRIDNSNIDDSSQKNVHSGSKDVKVFHQDKSRIKNKPILRSDNNGSSMLASQGDVAAGGEDEKTNKEYKIQKGMNSIVESNNDNRDVQPQNDAPAIGKDVEAEKKDNQLNLLIDDENFDVPLQSMLRSRSKDAKMKQKNKGQKKKLHVSMNDNNDGRIPIKNATPVEDVLHHAGKDAKVENLDEGLIKKQIFLENDNDGDFISEIDSSAKGNAFWGGKNAKIEEKDEDCDLGRALKFEEGDMVWAKVKSHPWWPGQVYNPIFAAPKARKLKPDHTLIAFFGDSSYGWFLESDLVPFEQNYVEKSKQSMQRGFTKAVEEAVDEISRRAALGLMCGCRNGDAFRPRKQEGYVNVDIHGYVNPGLYSFRQIEVAKNTLKPADMLSFVRNLAVSPCSGKAKSISGIKSVAEVLAYRVATFVSVNEDYQSAMRIKQSRAYFGADAQDQSELESGVGCSDVREEIAPVNEENEISMHFKVKDLARKSIFLEKSSDMEDDYLLKRREGIHRRSSSAGEDFLYVMQDGFMPNSQANSETKVEEVDDSDCIGRYLFKKRMQSEECKPAERKRERKDKKRNLLRELGDHKEERARKKEVVRKAFHMKPLDREKESSVPIIAMELCETKELTKGDIPEAQVRQMEADTRDFCMRSMNGGEETLMSTVLKNTSQVQELNDLCNPDVGMSGVVCLTNQVSNDVPCINDLLGSSVAQVDCDLKSNKNSHQKQHDKNPVGFINNPISNICCGRVVEDSLEGGQLMDSTIICEDVDHRVNIVEGKPMSSGKELSDHLNFQDTDSRDASRDQQVTQASFTGIHKESFFEKELGLELAALESSSSGEIHSRKVLQSVDLKNTSLPGKGQTENKVANALDNAGSSDFEGLLSVNLTKPIILKSEGLDDSFDKSGVMVENIELETEAEKSSNKLSASLVDVSMDPTESGHNFTASLALSNVDHAVIKKTKGFKRLVKFAKSSASKVKRIKRISNNETHLFDDPEPPEKQCKVSAIIEDKSEAVKDLTSGLDTENSNALDNGMATPADGNQVACILPDQSEDNKIPCKEVFSEESRFCISEIVDDLLSLALNPFYGIERDCPSKVSLVFLKFRSLVYQKSLTSISSSVASKNLPSLHEIESDLETKKNTAIEESNSKHLNVKDGVTVDNGNFNLASNDIVSQTSSKKGNSISPVLKIGKSQKSDANTNKKRKLEIKSGGLSLMKRLRKVKDLDSAPSNLTSTVLKSSGILRENESVQQPKVSKKSHINRSSSSSKSLEAPMALCMKFPRGFALPSEVQLKVRFARFGPLDVSGTRIYCKSGSAQVVFKYSSDAETAYKYATENNLFGQANVSFWLKQNLQPKKETSVVQCATELARLPRVSNDEVPSLMSAMGQDDSSSLRSLDKYGTVEAVAEGTSKLAHILQPVVQLKSCMKRPDESGADSGKETNRVTFMIGREEPNLVPEISMENPFQIENVCLPSSTFLPIENSGIVNPPIENKAMESDPPNISHQMLYLLMKCNDIVTDIGRSLGYMPYCSL